MTNRKREPHWLCTNLRKLRHGAGLSLGAVERRFPQWSAVVLGSYERGDREPGVSKLDAAYNLYGFELAPRPIGEQKLYLPDDMVSTLRAMADQLEVSNDLQHVPHTTALSE